MKFNNSNFVPPNHVAFIMDGNGRWAKNKGLARSLGHEAGVKTLMSIMENCFTLGVKYVTVYAFSTENWNRPKEEVDALIQLFRNYFSNYFSKITKKGIKINVWGDKSKFPQDVIDSISKIENSFVDKPKGVFNIALNYGGRKEIIDAVNTAIKNGKELDEKEFSSLLYSSSVPDPDLIIRTGGEYRLSNFLLFQSAYSELFFTKTLWPDFNNDELLMIFTAFANRERRFGKVK